MAYPILAKSYAYANNVGVTALGVALDTNRRQLRTLKNAIVGLGGGSVWTVDQSCNSTTAGAVGDNVDRWTSDSALVSANAGVAHSWCVLESIAGFKVCIDLTQSSGTLNAISFFLSPGGAFTGGSTTARPTAVDEITLLTSNQWGAAGDAASRIHVLGSLDGTVLHVMLATGGTIAYTWHIFRPIGDVPALWVNPVLGRIAAGAVNLHTATILLNNSTFLGRGQGGVAIACSLTTEGRGTAGAVAGQYSSMGAYRSGWPMSGMGVFCTTPGHVDQLGIVPDFFFTVDAATQATGTLTDQVAPDPADGRFVKVGSVWLPHNFTTLLLS